MIFLGSDHGGFQLKEYLQNFLEEEKVANIDMGCFTGENVDYPDIAKTLCEQVIKEKAMGVLVCGTGIGMSMSANKFSGIRAALCHDVTTAKLAREHNDANVLCLGGRLIANDLGKEILKTFMETKFEGGRHERRVNMMKEFDTKR